MGLWKRIRRLLPLGAFVAVTVLANKYFRTDVEPRITKIEQQHGNECARKKFLLWLLSGSTLSLAALGAAHVVQRKKGKRNSFLQPAVEHPYLSGGITALTYGITGNAHINDSIISAYVGGCLGSLTTLVTAGMSHVKPPYVINYAKNIIDTFRSICAKNPVQEQAILERIRTYYSQPALVDLELVDVLFRQEKVDEALDVLKRAVSHLDQGATPFTLERLLSRPLSYGIVAAFKGQQGSFWEFYANLRQGDFGDALAALDRFAASGNDLNHIAARAYALHMLNDLRPAFQRLLPKHDASLQEDLERRAQTAWQDTITAVLTDPQREKQFKLMGESRNEVLEYAPNKFLQGLLVFKRCDHNEGQRLRTECTNVQALHEQLGHQIVQSMGYVEHDGKAYHILRHQTSRTLETVLKNSTNDAKQKALIGAATLLYKIHFHSLPDTMPDTAPRYFERLLTIFYQQLRQRPSVFIPRAIQTLLSGACGRMGMELKDAVHGSYKDANPRNWLVEDDGLVVAIDFEHNYRAPIQLDLVSLLEFGSVQVLPNARCAVLKHYIRSIERDKPLDRHEFFRQYRWAALQRHLELAGYRGRDREFKAVQYHIGRAQKYAQRLGEHALAEQLAKISVAS